MWIVTSIGFFSAVQKPGTDHLTIRARVREDLDNLREHYLPELSETVGGIGTDYPWRATVSHEAFAQGLADLVRDIDYSNFKNEVAAVQGNQRAHRYHHVWSALASLPDTDESSKVAKALPWSSVEPPGKHAAYGGVVFDAEGRVLLREPKNHFDRYVWTFPKGRQDRGETPAGTALRETLEETGVGARIVAPIPGEYLGGSSINRYFLMVADAGTEGVPEDDPETSDVRWFTVEQARTKIALTTNPQGRERDLTVLEAALELRAAVLR